MKKPPNYAIDAHYPPEIQQMMAEATHCLKCGKMLEYHERKEGRRNRGYCSLSHYCQFPPKMAYAEKEYGKPIKEIVIEMLNNGTGIVATADRLGIGRPQFYKWMDKLDIKKKVVWG